MQIHLSRGARHPPRPPAPTTRPYPPPPAQGCRCLCSIPIPSASELSQCLSVEPSACRTVKPHLVVAHFDLVSSRTSNLEPRTSNPKLHLDFAASVLSHLPDSSIPTFPWARLLPGLAGTKRPPPRGRCPGKDAKTLLSTSTWTPSPAPRLWVLEHRPTPSRPRAVASRPISHHQNQR